MYFHTIKSNNYKLLLYVIVSIVSSYNHLIMLFEMHYNIFIFELKKLCNKIICKYLCYVIKIFILLYPLLFIPTTNHEIKNKFSCRSYNHFSLFLKNVKLIYLKCF